MRIHVGIEGFTISGLGSKHVEVLDAVMRLVQLGTKGYPRAAFELVDMFNKAGYIVDVDARCTRDGEVVLE